MIIKLLITILPIFLIIISAICNAGMDVLYADFKGSRFGGFNENFWDPYKSWKNKWKNGDRSQGEKFWLSSTVLVWMTDGWHFLKTALITLIVLASICYVPLVGRYTPLIYMCLWLASFELSLRFLRRQ